MMRPVITVARRDVFGRRSVMDKTRGGLEVPVQHEGVEVCSIGPHDGAQLVVHAHLSEVAGIGQRLEHGTVQLPGEIDVACAAVTEAKPEFVVTKHIYRGDAYELHTPILRQRVDGLGRTPVLCPLPVGFQLIAMQTRPLGHSSHHADELESRSIAGLGERMLAYRANTRLVIFGSPSVSNATSLPLWS